MFFSYKLLKSLQQAATNWIEKGTLLNIFGDTLHKDIFHQFCKIQLI